MPALNELTTNWSIDRHSGLVEGQLFLCFGSFSQLITLGKRKLVNRQLAIASGNNL